ncbi:MAG: hypothetical protein H7Y38_19375 [Armatimonadetes bacterium]|nr:hypothetical protein [Armatimonadota bacterium]
MSDSEIILQHGDLYARVSPHGASLRGLWRENADGTHTEIVTGYSGADNKVGGQGDVLIPFPGRIKNGTYDFGGETFQLQLTDKEAPNAIHGFVRQKEWTITEQTENSTQFETDILPSDAPGYPFALHIKIRYSMREDMLACWFVIENSGQNAAPVAAGFHPYFTVGGDFIDGAVLTVPFDSVLEFDDNLTPTGKVLPVAETAFDFRKARTIGTTRFNTCYLNPNRDDDGGTQICLESADGGRSITVSMHPVFEAVVLYSGDPLPDAHRRRSLAIEPMTGGSDVFNHPEWGLRTLAPGERFSGGWSVWIHDDNL